MKKSMFPVMRYRAFYASFLGSVLLYSGMFTDTTALAREAGWVPIPQNQEFSPTPKKPTPTVKNIKKAASGKKNITSQQKTVAPVPTNPNATVYDSQPLVKENEVRVFLDLLPEFRAWTRKNGEEAHPVVNRDGRPDFFYSPAAARWVTEHNFEPTRFFCVMGRMAAGLVIVEEGNDFKGTRPADMPEVAPQELELVRRHLGSLLTAGGPPQPLK